MAWLSRMQLLESWTCIKLVVMHGHHPFASIMARHGTVFAGHLAVSKGDPSSLSTLSSLGSGHLWLTVLTWEQYPSIASLRQAA